jgi:predicted amidophosphoribosyltransferase
MSTIINLVSDLFFPKTTPWNNPYNSYLTKQEIESLQAKILFPENSSLDYVWVCSDFDDPKIEYLIKQAKLNGETKIAEDLSKIVLFQLDNQIKSFFTEITGKVYQINQTLKKPDLITFVPPDPNRFRKRGYHIPELIARQTAFELGVNVMQLVSKNKSTVSQGLLEKDKRLQNLNGAFLINKNINNSLTNFYNLWLIDDITTTGTTIEQVAKIIKKQYQFLTIHGVVIAS